MKYVYSQKFDRWHNVKWGLIGANIVIWLLNAVRLLWNI